MSLFLYLLKNCTKIQKQKKLKSFPWCRWKDFIGTLLKMSIVQLDLNFMVVSLQIQQYRQKMFKNIFLLLEIFEKECKIILIYT